MSYRPQVKADSNGTTQDLPIDAETVQGKTPVFTTTNQTVAGVKTYTDIQTFKGGITLYAESGDSPRLTFQRGTLIDNYNDWSIYDSGGYLYIQKSGSAGYETRATFTTTGVDFVGTIKENGTSLVDKFSPISHSHESVLDYGDTNKTIKIGYSGAGLTASQISYIAGYTAGANDNEHKIKDISKDVLKSWLGYASAEVTTGALSINTSLIIETGYVYLIFLKGTNTSFKFGTSKTNLRYTAYGYMIVQGGSPVLCRYFSNTTTITMATVGSSTLGLYFDSSIQYIKFYAG